MAKILIRALVIIFISLTCFLYQITDMFQDIYSHPITVSVQIKYPTRIQMPTITICNSNKIKESSLKNYTKNSDLYKMITFEALNSIGLVDIEESLREKLAEHSGQSDDGGKPDSGGDSQGDNAEYAPAEPCDTDYVVDWNDDASIRNRLFKV